MAGIKRTAEEHCNAPLRSDVCGRRLGHNGQHISAGGLVRYAQQTRERYAADPEVREKALARSRERVERRRVDPHYRELERIQDRRRRYGLLPGDYEALLIAQNGRCGICAEPFGPSPHVDHNHQTGEVRGLLCRRCNRAIGLFRDDPELLARASRWVG